MAYDAKKADFIQWLRLGTKEARLAKGQPPTITAWAEAYGVDRVTCQRWKIDPEVKKDVVNHGITLFSVDELKAAREKLVERATVDGNTTALKLMLEWAGIVGKDAGESAASVSPDKWAGMTDAEIEAALAEVDDE